MSAIKNIYHSLSVEIFIPLFSAVSFVLFSFKWEKFDKNNWKFFFSCFLWVLFYAGKGEMETWRQFLQGFWERVLNENSIKFWLKFPTTSLHPSQLQACILPSSNSHIKGYRLITKSNTPAHPIPISTVNPQMVSSPVVFHWVPFFGEDTRKNKIYIFMSKLGFFIVYEIYYVCLPRIFPHIYPIY